VGVVLAGTLYTFGQAFEKFTAGYNNIQQGRKAASEADLNRERLYREREVSAAFDATQSAYSAETGQTMRPANTVRLGRAFLTFQAFGVRFNVERRD